MTSRLGTIAVAGLALASCSKTPEPIRITGSSTVFPFTKAVADAYVQAQPGRMAPAIDSIGTGPGIRAFCAGVGRSTPDIVDASRRIKKVEFDGCRRNDVGEVGEVRIGLDGIALAEATGGPKLQLSRKDIYLALAASPAGKPNTAKTWKDVDPSLPAAPIKVLGPAPGSGTHDQFVDLLLEPGCVAAVPEAKEMQTKGDPAAFDRLCRQIRTDAAYVTGGEDYAKTARTVEKDPQAVGVFGYSYLEANAGQLHGVPIDGVAPEQAEISSGKYPGGRTLFLYVKKRHLKEKPELQAFLDQYAGMWDPNGPLAKKGLIAMSDSARERSKAAVKDGELLDGEALF